MNDVYRFTQEQFDKLGQYNYDLKYGENECGKGRYLVWETWLDGKRYKMKMSKARYIYQLHHGVISNNWVVVTKDNNALNFDIKNLIAITKRDFGYIYLIEKMGRERGYFVLESATYHQCTKCECFYHESFFTKRSLNKKFNIMSWCKDCVKKYKNEWNYIKIIDTLLTPKKALNSEG